ncbi:MAG TPA: penicillin-binding transpeptidase domain-containing protein [Acidobacteriaceae bacterium]|nr:penicillin-binding transpeptidase domain-containing protein [Acidobacteriaceae bacterium]
MKLRLLLPRLLFLSLLAGFVAMGTVPVTLAATIDTPRVNVHRKSRHVRSSRASHRRQAYRGSIHSSATVRHTSYAHHRRRYRHRYYERFTASSYAQDQTAGDITAGEDPVVRQAAVSALGDMNGTVVVIDPNNGRILTMVNHHLALSSGAEPCSTIKLSVALAALEEGIVTANTPVNLGGRYHMTLTDALAHSNNLYFETVGRRLGFERVKYYANMFGLGELAGYNMPGEQLGVYPSHVLPESKGGVGRMCSFGERVSVTPLQLGALISAIANGGTLYYLQHPETPVEVANFHPRVKRELNIGPLLPSMSVGMTDVVKFGTGRSVLANFKEFPVLGKTGTCSDNGTRFGWFGSYANTPYGRLVAVFFLEGGRPTYGPKAAELAGIFYHNLQEQNYYTTMAPPQPNGEMSALAGH